jgi:hypothetical protein
VPITCCESLVTLVKGQKQIAVSTLAYVSTLVVGSRREGTCYIRWAPTIAAYRKCIKRMNILADPDYDFGHMSPFPTASNDFIDSGYKIRDSDAAHEVGDETEEFHQRFYEICMGRAFFSTMHGRFGLGSTRMRKDDKIVVLQGGRTPFVVRASEQDQSFKLIGECYVYGLMDGETFAKGGELTSEEWIILS